MHLHTILLLFFSLTVVWISQQPGSNLSKIKQYITYCPFPFLLVPNMTRTRKIKGCIYPYLPRSYYLLFQHSFFFLMLLAKCLFGIQAMLTIAEELRRKARNWEIASCLASLWSWEHCGASPAISKHMRNKKVVGNSLHRDTKDK